MAISRRLLKPEYVTQAKAAHFAVEFIKLSDLRIEDDVISSVPRHIAKRYRAVPVSKYGSSVRIAVTDPSDLDTLDSLQRSISGDPEWCVATEEDLEAALNKYYGAADDSVGKMIQDITEGEVDIGAITKGLDSDDGGTVEADAPIIKLVNSSLLKLSRSRASDIHLEPLSKTFRVRYRIDGVLME